MAKSKRTIEQIEAQMVKLKAKRTALREEALALAAERNALIAEARKATPNPEKNDKE